MKFKWMLVFSMLLVLFMAGCGSGLDKYSIAGYVVDDAGKGVAGVQIIFSGNATAATTDQNGFWGKSQLSGTVTVTPVKTGWKFTPENKQVLGQDTHVDFVGHPEGSYTVSGQVKDDYGQGVANVTIAFDGGLLSVQTDGEGKWSKSGLKDTVKITPAKAGWVFTPANFQVTGARSDVNFTAHQSVNYTISGRLTDANGTGLSNVEVAFSGETTSVYTDSEGRWSKGGLNGTLTVTPKKTGWLFIPASQDVSASKIDVDFVGQPLYTLSGKVTYINGSPAKGVTIDFLNENNQKVATCSVDNTGHWTKNDLFGTITVVPSRPRTQTDPTLIFTPTQKTFTSSGTVDFSAEPKITRIDVTPNNVSVKENETLQMTATCYDDAIQSNVAIVQPTWTVVHGTGTGSITQTGVFTGKTIGTVTIEARHGVVGTASLTVIHQSTSYVPGDYATIQAAIDAAIDGDTVIVKPGRYIENLDFKGKTITLRSTNPADANVVMSTIIDGGSKSACILIKNVKGEAIIDGLTLTNGTGISVQGVDDTWRTCGGAIFISASSVTIRNNIIQGNSAVYGGGIRADYWNHNYTLRIEHNTVQQNTSTEGGGGIVIQNGKSIIDSNIIRENQALGNNSDSRGWGGGIEVFTDADTTITNNTIAQNKANIAGGIYGQDNAQTIISANLIQDNTADSNGGVLCYNNSIDISDNTFSGNSSPNFNYALYIGALQDETLSTVTIMKNIFENGFGTIYLRDGSARVELNQFKQNQGTFRIYQGNHTVKNNTFSGNHSDYGGALLVSGNVPSVVLVGNTFANNSATYHGGAVYVGSGAKLLNESGGTLPNPDTYNIYANNTPENIYYYITTAARNKVLPVEKEGVSTLHQDLTKAANRKK